jgi:hypothetical protein
MFSFKHKGIKVTFFRGQLDAGEDLIKAHRHGKYKGEACSFFFKRTHTHGPSGHGVRAQRCVNTRSSDRGSLEEELS